MTSLPYWLNIHESSIIHTLEIEINFDILCSQTMITGGLLIGPAQPQFVNNLINKTRQV